MPLRIERSELRTDSGGEGHTRGGLGMRRERAAALRRGAVLGAQRPGGGAAVRRGGRRRVGGRQGLAGARRPADASSTTPGQGHRPPDPRRRRRGDAVGRWRGIRRSADPRPGAGAARPPGRPRLARARRATATAWSCGPTGPWMRRPPGAARGAPAAPPANPRPRGRAVAVRRGPRTAPRPPHRAGPGAGPGTCRYDLVELQGRHPAPLRAWIAIDAAGGSADIGLDELGRRILGIAPGDTVEIRRLAMPPVPGGLAG